MHGQLIIKKKHHHLLINKQKLKQMVTHVKGLVRSYVTLKKTASFYNDVGLRLPLRQV